MLSAAIPSFRLWAVSLVLVGVVACESATTEPPHASASSTREPAMQGGALDPAGAFFVGNFSVPLGDPRNGILRYDARGTFVDAFVPQDMSRFGIPCCFTFGPDDHLYVASPIFETILRFDGATGEFIDEFVAAGENGPKGILVPQFGPDGNLYVGEFGAEFASPAIRRFDGRTGAFIDVFVKPNAGGMVGVPDPQFFTWGPDGHLYVAAPAAGKVLRFDGRTGDFLDAAVSNQDGRPAVGSGIVFGDDGLLYVTSPDGGVSRYDVRTGELVDVFVEPGSPARTDAVGLVFGPDGHLYFAVAESGPVLRYDGRTGAFIDEFIPAGRGGLSGPRMVAFKMKTKVCHAAPGRPDQTRTLSVGQLDAADHVRHGDHVGTC